MEQQTCSIAKGGIVATLNARTSILAAANPLYGKYNPMKNITENINLPIPLLTRFDLVWIVRDIPDDVRDRQISGHILDIHTESAENITKTMDLEFLSKYLSYCKKRKDPKLTQKARNVIQEFYMRMRKTEAENMITITPRQLEGLVRLATARAKLLLKDQVDESDAERAVFLVEKMLSTVGVDVNTGQMDLGTFHGAEVSKSSKISIAHDIFLSLYAKNGKNPVPDFELKEEMMKTGKYADTDDCAKYLEDLRDKANKILWDGRTRTWNRG
jgi:replicative DNA helicase Mcm